MRRTLWTAAPAVALVPLLCGAAPATAAAAASTGNVTVTDTESVQVHLDASGAFQDARVFDQLAFAGTGTATVRNPVSTSGLRNLDGFRGWKVEDGHQVATVEVDGERRLRSMSNYDKDLPLSVAVTYALDGKAVQPGDVVGRSGTLEVHYVVENLTAKTEQVSFADGTGGTATADATTVVPMIGELVTVLPPSFTAVTSQEAAIGGDGRGGTQLQFQMTLFPPIGSAKAEFGYSAHISKGVVPKATMTALPVSPLDFPSYKDGSATIKAGGEQGVALTSGAVEIDANLVKLHDGAAQLLAGLDQLRDGADQLHSGLAGDAAPGADTLAVGLNQQAAPGARALATGLTNDAAPGAKKLAAGAEELHENLALAAGAAPGLIDGLGQVADGLELVDAGLADLSSTLGASQTQQAATQQLHAGIAQLRAGLGSTSAPTPAGSPQPTLLGSLEALRLGAAQKITGVGLPPADAAKTALPAATAIATNLAHVQAWLTALAASTPAVQTDPNYQQAAGTVQALAPSASALAAGIGALAQVLDQSLVGIECGVDGASSAACPAADPKHPTVKEALALIDGGIDQMVGELVKEVQKHIGTPQTDPDTTLRGGLAALENGTDLLGAGAAPLVDGLGQLAAGAGRLSSGAGELSSGISDAASGSSKLADGLQDAAAGSSRLAAGLHDAADGSGRIADGLGQATDETTGAPALVEGAQRLHDEGTSQVVASGEETAASFGTQYAVLQANAKRAATEGMAYGAPEGAAGATAYSIEIAGADGAGSKALGLGAAGVVLFGLGAGIATLVRRRLV